MKKKIKDLTLEDYKRYGNLRVYDGNWSREMALTFVTFLEFLPKKKLFESKKKYNQKCENIFKENLTLLWNLGAYPNMTLNIETGEIENDE